MFRAFAPRMLTTLFIYLKLSEFLPIIHVVTIHNQYHS